MSEKQQKLFSVEEANQRLPLVRSIVRDIVALHKDVEQREERLHEIHSLRPDRNSKGGDSIYSEEVEDATAELDKDRIRLREFVNELHTLGVELKDAEQGLVDFRSLVDGREVYLCWKSGEDDIAFWHELDAGFGGRQPLLATVVGGDQDEDSLSI